jgi:hypothetical protein
VTLVIVAITAAFMLLDVVWPETSDVRSPGVLFGAFMALGNTLGPAARFRDWLIVTAAGLPAVLVVGLIVDQVRPLDSQPAWAYHLSTAFAGWVGCLTGIWVSQLRVRRRRAKAMASSGPSRTTLER